jgi:hypothetical protein
MEKKTYIEIDDQYRSGVCLNEYDGKISICSAHQDNDDTVYLDWIYPQTKDRKPSEKMLPWKITLGKPDEALKRLHYLARMLEAKNTECFGTFDKDNDVLAEKGSSPANKKDDVPF